MNVQPYTSHNGITCVVGSAVIDTVLPLWKWKNLGKKADVGYAQRAGRGRPSLIAFDKLPSDVRAKVVAHYGAPKVGHPPSGLEERLKADPIATTYFSRRDLGISDKRRPQYIANAMVLNALIEAQDTERNARAAHGATKGDFWTRASKAVNGLPTATGHNLPKNERALKRKVDEYRKAKDTGTTAHYELLVHKGHGHQNALKVTYTLEQLIISIACLPEKPFAETVWEYLALFLAGKREVFDKDSGEVYDPSQFKNPDGSPLTVSKATVWNHMMKPVNVIIIDAHMMGGKRFNDTHVPHHHRHAVQWAFSKITMDDRDLPRKMANGDRVKAYYTYDCASGVVIGRAYSRDKNRDLLIDCFRDTFQFVQQFAPGKVPAQVEVEHHLVNEMRDQLEEVFPLVRWCNPGNSQEKSAEHFNRSKKYGVERKNHQGVGRWWARARQHQMDEMRESDGSYRTKTYTFDQLVAEDMADCAQYNAELHPNQKKYPGMSRLDVLKAFKNPELTEIDRPLLVRMIGDHTRSSINRSDYLTVKHAKYQLSGRFDDLAKLSANKKVVDAYHLAEPDGIIREVHVFQNGRFIATCPLVGTYGRANVEWTDADRDNYASQSEHVSKWNAEMKAMKKGVAKVGVVKTATMPAEAMPTVPTIQQDEQEWTDTDYDTTNYSQRALDTL